MCRKTPKNLSRWRSFHCPDCLTEFRARLVKDLSCEHVHVYEGDCVDCGNRISYINGPFRLEVIALRKIVAQEYAHFGGLARVETWGPFVVARFIDEAFMPSG